MHSHSEEAIEQEIQAKGLTAPRITPADIDASILYEEYFRVANTTCTICSLVLQNGFVVVGKSAATSLDNFDEEIGRKVARENAREQIWELAGYLLKQKLYDNQ